MTKIVEKLFAAATNHGEDSGEPDHTVGDLQDLFRSAWALMSVSQQRQLLRSNEVQNVVECGARGEFDCDDLEAEITNKMATLEAEVKNAGYEIKVNLEGTHFWENNDEASEDFPTRLDAIADAHKHLTNGGGMQEPSPSQEDEGHSEELLYPKVVVLCHNSEGTPEFHTCAPEVTRQQFLAGEHYTLAKENAVYNCFDEPMIAFDKTDAAACQMGNVSAWL